MGLVARVAAFDKGAELSQELDFRLMHSTFVTMFWDERILAEALEWLTARGYQVID